MKPRFARTSTQIQPDESARAIGLRYGSDGHPGLKRIKAGKAFRYVDAQGKAIRDEATLKRIRSLAIPPAWTDVWICQSEDGHLQATGRDAKGRKQHRYHPLWREVRDATKFDRTIEFAMALPKIRRRVSHDITRSGLARERVLATVVRLMDLAFLRVGNEEYARNNHSFGLTTLKDRHAIVRGERIRFEFPGKSGRRHRIELEDRRLARIVKNCQEIPGQDLFQFYDEAGARRDVTSGDVNDYLREISGADFTAKDFRTWAGTVLAAQELKQAARFDTQRQAKRNVARALEKVAGQLGNTPAVCRKCYVHPAIIDRYLRHALPCQANVTSRHRGEAIGISSRPMKSLGVEEREVLEFLRCCRREERRELRQTKSKLKRLPNAWRPRVVRGRRAVGRRGV